MIFFSVSLLAFSCFLFNAFHVLRVWSFFLLFFLLLPCSIHSLFLPMNSTNSHRLGSGWHDATRLERKLLLHGPLLQNLLFTEECLEEGEREFLRVADNVLWRLGVGPWLRTVSFAARRDHPASLAIGRRGLIGGSYPTNESS